MNFRSCKYFLAVCEMGTINAAARKLYISPQSLSQHIRKLEEELDVQLFHRDNPLALTDAGRIVEQAATDLLRRLDQMEQELNACRESATPELTIGMLDYGIPDFVPPLIDQFLKQEPNILLKTREIPAGEPIPQEISLLFSAKELGGRYKSEVLFSDSLVVCVRDELLERTYGADWRAHKARLQQGDLHALEGCPFVQHRNTPFEALAVMAFSANHFKPDYLPVMGTIQTFERMCIDGHAAMTSFLGQAKNNPQMPEAYRIPNTPDPIPASYICYPADVQLSGVARRFLEITRRYFRRGENR